MSDYYDWDTTRSKNADITIVVGARDYGKTFGMRKFFVSDYINKGIRFCEVTRVKDEIADIANDYVEKLKKEGFFTEYMFKYARKRLMVARIPEEGKKPKWDVCGYFASISTFQADKKRTFVHCRNIGMDEYLIEPDDQYHDYAPNEWYKLASLVDSISRERPLPKEDGIIKKAAEAVRRKKLPKPRVYLLGNAVSLDNPAFAHYGIDNIPQYGYSWHGGKTCILHYVEDQEFAAAKRADTVAGRMLASSKANESVADNVFIGANDDFIASKPKGARYSFGFAFRGELYGVWADYVGGYYYINKQVPNNAPGTVYAVSTKDATFNRAFAKSAKKPLQQLTELYGYGLVRFDSRITRSEFNRMCACFGLR